MINNFLNSLLILTNVYIQINNLTNIKLFLMYSLILK